MGADETTRLATLAAAEVAMAAAEAAQVECAVGTSDCVETWCLTQFLATIPPPPFAPPVLAATLEPTLPPPQWHVPGALSEQPDIAAELPVPPPPSMPLLSIPEEISQPMLGTPEMPTVGSLNHCTGTCRPCAHAHSRGCKNGVQCNFCHLCPPGELKRRQKARMKSWPLRITEGDFVMGQLC